MKKTVVVYGSTTGTAEDLATRISKRLDGADVINVTTLTPEVIAQYDNLLLGTSTWGSGELQDDWYAGIEVLASANLEGKTIALWGCGDSEGFADTYCDGMAEIKRAIDGKGANLVGQVSTQGYNHSYSASVEDGQFIGLALDEVNQSDLTDERIAGWIAAIIDKL